MYEDLIKELREYSNARKGEIAEITKEAADAIEELSKVRAVVKAIWKHVQWVVDEEWQEGGYWISRCSNCSMPYHTETPFCPHCGADMRGEKGAF